MKKLLLILALGLALTSINPKDSVAQSCTTTPPTNTGTSTMSATTIAGTYRVWARMKAADSNNNSFYLRIDSGCAILVGDNSQISSSTWTWVDYQNGVTSNKINATLTAGNHVITIIGNEAGVSVDKILMTKNLTCIPTGFGDNCPAELPVTPTNSPTTPPTNTPTPTARPTNTPTPTNIPTTTPTPLVTPAPEQTVLKFNIVKLHGIGTGGDNTNPNIGGNSNPITQTRKLTVELFDTNGNLAKTAQGNIIYGSGNGYFSGSVILDSSVLEGPYQLKIKTDKYLRRQLSRIITITRGATIELPEATLVVGDSNGDGTLSILDYNIILDCYSDLLTPKSCEDPAKKAKADISDDGKVNQDDHTLFLRELSVVSGD